MQSLFFIRKPLPKRWNRILFLSSFLIPILIWCAVSYLPFLWHPMVKITNPGGVKYFKQEMLVAKKSFQKENRRMQEMELEKATGYRSNPIYLPAPHEVVISLVYSFTSPPRRAGSPWLHQSLLHSIEVVFMGFLLSSLIGLPLGILCGTYNFFGYLVEPFVEYFRYLPAPVFGALAVAVLGINDGPKIAIVFIGTFFQQVMVISNTTSKLNISLIEAAQTLGASNFTILKTVVIPGTLPDIYKDMRILLGWAWTYLIVAEVVGTSTGITWFINQQAKYRNFDKVYAAILILGIIGLVTDQVLAAIGKKLFKYQNF